MPILALGISHRRATVDLLERLAFDEETLARAYRRVEDHPAIEGAVILSTCNRVEIYGSVPSYHAGFPALKRLLCESAGASPDEVDEPLYSHYETDATQHAFAVAGGLDSMVLGEPQILAQVREALRAAERRGAADQALTELFQAASRTGRRVRSETAVGAAPDSFVAAGADLAEEALAGLEGRSAVVLGAGQMSALAVKHLRRRGVATVRIVNRSPERARVLAERYEADHGGLERLPEAIADADVMVCATGAAGIVVTTEHIRHAMEGRTRPLFVLDLAVPRDVESTAREVPEVVLIDIEGLKDSLAARAAEATEEIEKARAIVADEVRRFTLRRRAARLAPLIRSLRRRGDEIVDAELDRFDAELATLTPEERRAVESLARGIVAKLLHDPIVRVKERSAPGGRDADAKLLAELFGIEPDPA
ncbi:MAG: glutamyl-tRNA reductase [Actinomycetota bacterium]